MEFLLIDDDADDRMLFKEALEVVDATIVCTDVPGAEEAFGWLQQQEHLPDLVFLDINLPVMSGWEFLKKLKGEKQWRSIPVIIYSTSSHQRDKDIAAGLGALHFITKPDRYKEIGHILGNVVEHLKNNKAIG